jgi:hypothetical protein
MFFTTFFVLPPAHITCRYSVQFYTKSAASNMDLISHILILLISGQIETLFTYSYSYQWSIGNLHVVFKKTDEQTDDGFAFSTSSVSKVVVLRLMMN